MVVARCVTNLDGKFPSWSKSYLASFPAMPSVGQTFMWNDMRCKIVDIRWEKNPEGRHALVEELMMVVEFNK
jgi:hypothetical protein